MLKRMKKQMNMADFQNLQQYLQSTMLVKGDRDDYDMIGDSFRINGRNSFAIDRYSRNNTRLPDYNDDLDDYDMIGEHYGSPFPGDTNHGGDGKFTDVKFFNSFADDFDDSDIV